MASEDITAEDAQQDDGAENPSPSVKPSFTQETGPMMILSLFLLLLAFFILLVTLSTINNQKKVAVFNSLSAAFRVQRQTQEDLNVMLNNVGHFENKDVLDEMKDLWLSLLQLKNIDFPTTGKVMELSLHSNDLFEPGTTNLRAAALMVIQRMVLAMDNPKEGFSAQVTFNLKNILDVNIETALKQYFDGSKPLVEFQHSEMNKDSLDPRLYFSDLQRNNLKSLVYETNRDTLQYLRVLSFAYALENAGATPKWMLIGIQEGVPDTALIRFERFTKQQE